MPPEVSPTPEEARATRRAKLFARWSGGGRLSKDEQAEIADLIAAAKGEPAALDLAAEEPGKAPVYSKTYEAYAAVLPFAAGSSIESRVRMIKRWVQTGRDHQPVADYPPLDDPPRMGAWLLRTHRRRLTVWDGFFKIAEPPKVPGEVSGAEKNSKPSAPHAPAPTSSIDLKNVAGFDALAALDAQRRAAAAAYELYSEALRNGTSDLDQRHRAWTAASAELRKTEKDTEDLREARGELVPRDRIVAELRRLHTAMAGSLRQVLSDRAIAPTLAAEIITEFFSPLRRGEFGLADSIPAAPAPPTPAAA